MAISLRAVRLKAAAQFIEQAPTIEEKVQGLRALVAMAKLGRKYIKFIQKQLLECRLSTRDMPDQEVRLAQLDVIDKKLRFALECEAARKEARKTKKATPAPVPIEPPPTDDPAALWLAGLINGKPDTK